MEKATELKVRMAMRFARTSRTTLEAALAHSEGEFWWGEKTLEDLALAIDSFETLLEKKK